MRRFEVIVPCHFGLESVLKREIADLGYDTTEVTDGRVTFAGDPDAVCRANICLRSAERVLIKVGSFRAETYEELFQGTKALPWEEFLPRNAKFWVTKASTVRSKIFSPSDIQSVMKKAMVERMKQHYPLEIFPEDGAEYPIRVFLLNDVVTCALDTTGMSLHKRGYRRLESKAPIAENLAAALIDLTPWKADRSLVDPFCGCGTIPIEAARKALCIAPGVDRSFTAENWTSIITKADWADVREEMREIAEEHSAERKHLDIQGYDLDPEMIKIARINAQKGGVEDCIHFQARDVKDLSHPGSYGFVITNPPYGERIGEASEMDGLYALIGSKIREMPTWSYYVISGYDQMEKSIGVRAAKNRKIYNGMIRTYFYQYPGQKPGFAGKGTGSPRGKRQG